MITKAKHTTSSTTHGVQTCLFRWLFEAGAINDLDSEGAEHGRWREKRTAGWEMMGTNIYIYIIICIYYTLYTNIICIYIIYVVIYIYTMYIILQPDTTGCFDLAKKNIRTSGKSLEPGSPLLAPLGVGPKVGQVAASSSWWHLGKWQLLSLLCWIWNAVVSNVVVGYTRVATMEVEVSKYTLTNGRFAKYHHVSFPWTRSAHWVLGQHWDLVQTWRLSTRNRTPPALWLVGYPSNNLT